MTQTPGQPQPVRIVCPIHTFPTTASWLEILGTCRCLSAYCDTGSDGYHAHVYRLGDPDWSRVVLTQHRHAWMSEHLAQHPDSLAVTIERGQRGAQSAAASLAAGWQAVPELAGVAVPAIACEFGPLRCRGCANPATLPPHDPEWCATCNDPDLQAEQQCERCHLWTVDLDEACGLCPECVAYNDARVTL